MTKDTKNGNAEQSEMKLSLEELIRRGAREPLQKAVEVELRELLGDYENVKMLGGPQAVVRNSYLPDWQVLTAVGPVDVRIRSAADARRFIPTPVGNTR